MGNQYLMGSAEEFKYCIDRLDLVDLPLTIGNWIWFNDQTNSSFIELTGFLCLQT